MCQFPENLRTDGRTDRVTLFYRTLPVEAGGPKKITSKKNILLTTQNCFSSITTKNKFFMLYNPPHSTDIFLYPLKTSETRGFLMFLRGTERNQWHEMS